MPLSLLRPDNAAGSGTENPPNSTVQISRATSILVNFPTRWGYRTDPKRPRIRLKITQNSRIVFTKVQKSVVIGNFENLELTVYGSALKRHLALYKSTGK